MRVGVRVRVGVRARARFKVRARDRSSTASNGEPPLDRADSARSDCGSAPG